LWMIFSLSLLLLWNNWQVHNGKPSLFNGLTQPAATAVQGSGEKGQQPASATVPNAPASSLDAAPAALPGASGAPEARSETVVVSTDVLRLTFDTAGAQIIRAELLKFPATGTTDQPSVLLDRSAGLTYLVQSGVIGGPAGASFPTHLTQFRVTSTARELQGDSLTV